MDRRSFLTSLLVGCGFVVGAGLIPYEAHASTRIESAMNIDPILRSDLSPIEEEFSDLPVIGAKEVRHRGFAHRGWGPRRYRRMQRCTVRRNRFGRRGRVCR